MSKAPFNFQLDNTLKEKLVKLSKERFTSVGSLLNHFAASKIEELERGIRVEGIPKVKKVELSGLIGNEKPMFADDPAGGQEADYEEAMKGMYPKKDEKLRMNKDRKIVSST